MPWSWSPSLPPGRGGQWACITTATSPRPRRVRRLLPPRPDHPGPRPPRWAQPKPLTCSTVSPRFPTRTLGAGDATRWPASLPRCRRCAGRCPGRWPRPPSGPLKCPASLGAARCSIQPHSPGTGRPWTRPPSAASLPIWTPRRLPPHRHGVAIHGRMTSADPDPRAVTSPGRPLVTREAGEPVY